MLRDSKTNKPQSRLAFAVKSIVSNGFLIGCTCGLGYYAVSCVARQGGDNPPILSDAERDIELMKLAGKPSVEAALNKLRADMAEHLRQQQTESRPFVGPPYIRSEAPKMRPEF